MPPVTVSTSLSGSAFSHLMIGFQTIETPVGIQQQLLAILNILDFIARSGEMITITICTLDLHVTGRESSSCGTRISR